MARETYNITVEPRSNEHKAKNLRKQGLLPLVMYGRGIDSHSLIVDQLVFERLLKKAGLSTIVMVTVEGAKKEEHPVLIHDIQYDALTDRPVHVDLYQVRMDEPIEADVSLIFIDEAPAAKEFDGILVESMRTIRVKALPLDLPHELEISLSSLKEIDDSISVQDLPVSEGVELLADPEATVVSVSPPRSEEELEELEEEIDEASAIESIEGEGEEGEGEGEETPEDETKEEEKSSEDEA